MKYDFTSILDRKGKDAIAVDKIGERPGFAPEGPEEGFDVIPMWVADMNFPVVPTIQQKIIERASHPAFGYFAPRDEYFDLIIKWHRDSHGTQGLTRANIAYENGVLGGVVSALRVFCEPGGKVLIHTPTYIGFTGVLKNNGFAAAESPLYRDADGIWRMDFEDMERQMAAGDIRCMIFCSPHNPTGRVWERQELERLVGLCEKYDVYLISDEIWSDLILPGHRHIPIGNVSETARRRSVAFYAPSKTFNLAGLIGSYRIVYDEDLMRRIEKQSSLSHYNGMNVLSMYALIGAYQPEGREWLGELLQVITENVEFACHHIEQNYDGITLARPEGTYMLYLDCSRWCREHGMTIAELEKAGWRVGVAWQDGEMFRNPDTIRVNLALPTARVREAFDRLDRYVFKIK